MSDLVKRLRTPMKGVTVQQCFKERSESAYILSALQEKNKALREALERLSTAECMGKGGALGVYLPDHPVGEEIHARMMFARAALEANKQEGGE